MSDANVVLYYTLAKVAVAQLESAFTSPGTSKLALRDLLEEQGILSLSAEPELDHLFSMGELG